MPDQWKLASAPSLIITFEDYLSSRSNCVSGAWEVLAVSLYPDDDYWMWRKAAKKKKKPQNWRTHCKVRFVTFSTFLSLQYLLSLSGFTSCILLCTELGRTFWPSPPKMGVALTGLSTEYVNIRKCAFFRCTWYQHFVFYRIFHRKGEFHFWQKLVHTVWKNRLWKSDWLKIALSAMLRSGYPDLPFSGWNKSCGQALLKSAGL